MVSKGVGLGLYRIKRVPKHISKKSLKSIKKQKFIFQKKLLNASLYCAYKDHRKLNFFNNFVERMAVNMKLLKRVSAVCLVLLISIASLACGGCGSGDKGDKKESTAMAAQCNVEKKDGCEKKAACEKKCDKEGCSKKAECKKECPKK